MAEKQKFVSMDALMKDLNKNFKDDCIHKGMSQYDYERIPFTSPNMNYMTHGGLPKGKLFEFYGEEHGGKTTTALDIVANFQQSDDGRKVLYADFENTLDYVWATKLGVDVEDMWILNPTNQSAEQCLEYLLRAIETNEIGLIVIDSIGVMVSQQALEKKLEERTYAGIAMALTNFSKQAEMLCNKHNCTIIGINQMRDKIDSTFGGTTTTGGRAWKHNCIGRIEFRRGSFLDGQYHPLTRGAENPQGNLVCATLTKSKFCSADRRLAQYTLMYDRGIDYVYDLIDVATKYGWIEKSGGWYTVVDPETGEVYSDKIQGASKLYEWLSSDDNLPVRQQVEAYIEEKANDKQG